MFDDIPGGSGGTNTPPPATTTTPPANTPPPATTTTSGDDGKPSDPIPRWRLNEVLSELKDTRNTLSSIQQQIKDKEADEAKKKGEWESLYGTTKAELDKLSGVADENKELKKQLKATVMAQVEALPEDIRALAPDSKDLDSLIAWLEKARGVVATRDTTTTTTTANGGGGTPGTPPKKPPAGAPTTAEILETNKKALASRGTYRRF